MPPWVFLLLPIMALGSPFVTTWNATQSPYRVTLTNISAQTNVTIDWGDGSPLTAIAAGTNRTMPSHNYTTAGFYNVSVNGNFRWKGDEKSNNAVKSKLIDIVSWGDGFLVDSNSHFLFNYYPNLRVSADPNTHPVFLAGAVLTHMFAQTSFDSPLNWDLGNNVTSLYGMFHITPLNKPITFTNTRGVQTLSFMFSYTLMFNQPFSFDCTNVGVLGSMFQVATAFNSSLNLTNTEKVNSTDHMFWGATSFNQPVILDTRSVTNMMYMFAEASNFNQAVNFNTSQVQRFDYMFSLASSFNQPLSMDTSQATSTASMFEDAVSFVGPVNFTSLTQVTNFDRMFRNVTAFTQDLSGWNVSTNPTTCDDFCPYCVLPPFTNCNPCPNGISTNYANQLVCYSRAPTTAAPTTASPSMSPTTASPTTVSPTTVSPTPAPTESPATKGPTMTPTTAAPSTLAPSMAPSTGAPSMAPSTASPSAVSKVSAASGTFSEPLLLMMLLMFSLCLL